MNSILKLISFGNSKGIRLPSRLLKRYGFTNGIQVKETAEGLLLLPMVPVVSLMNWEDTFIAMGHETEPEREEWQATLEDGLGHEPW